MGKEKKPDFYGDYQKLIDSFDKISKDADNPFFKSKYVPLSKILPLVKENCKKCGFVFFQVPDIRDGKSVLVTEFKHIETDRGFSGAVELVHKPEDPQKLGASITYMRRYSFSCMLGLEEVDDDGNYASGKVESISAQVGLKKSKVELLKLAKEGKIKCADCGEKPTVKKDGLGFYCPKGYMDKRPGVNHDQWVEAQPF